MNYRLTRIVYERFKHESDVLWAKQVACIQCACVRMCEWASIDFTPPVTISTLYRSGSSSGCTLFLSIVVLFLKSCLVNFVHISVLCRDTLVQPAQASLQTGQQTRAALNFSATGKLASDCPAHSITNGLCLNSCPNSPAPIDMRSCYYSGHPSRVS